MLHNFTRRFSFGSSDFFRCDIFRCNLFDGFYFDDFVESAGSPAKEIFFVRTPVGYAQLQLHYQVMDAIYLELQVTNNRTVVVAIESRAQRGPFYLTLGPPQQSGTGIPPIHPSTVRSIRSLHASRRNPSR